MAARKNQFFFNQTRGTLLAGEVRVASNFFSRLKGLLGTASLAPGTGIFITPCSQIHMFGMKYSIDVVFLDKNNTVVGLAENIGPGKVSRTFIKARGCLEIPAGTASDTSTEVGDIIVVGDSPYTSA